MPPEAGPTPATKLTGHCYCGRIRFAAHAAPFVVAYCHCSDCRRASGAPVAAFAGFSPDDVKFTPNPGSRVSVNPGVERWFCPDCGTPLAARFDYLPGQVYVPLGLIDQAADLPPQIHSHAASRLPWLHIRDDAKRLEGSSRAQLGSARAPE